MGVKITTNMTSLVTQSYVVSDIENLKQEIAKLREDNEKLKEFIKENDLNHSFDRWFNNKKAMEHVLNTPTLLNW